MLFTNGVMLGSFETFFHQHGLLLQSAMAVWLQRGTYKVQVRAVGNEGWKDLGKEVIVEAGKFVEVAGEGVAEP